MYRVSWKRQFETKIYKYLKDIGFVLPVILDPSAIISSDVQIGEGTFVGKNAIINAGVKIGKMAIINTQSLVEHECIVSDLHILQCPQYYVDRFMWVRRPLWAPMQLLFKREIFLPVRLFQLE